MVLNRRRFMTGGWPHPRAPAVVDDWCYLHCDVTVQVHPARAETALIAILACDGITIAQRNSDRLRLSLSGTAAADVALTLDTMTRIPGVLSATIAPPIPHPEQGRPT